MSRRLGPNASLDSGPRRPADHRLVPVALALWAGVLAGLTVSPLIIAVVAGGSLAVAILLGFLSADVAAGARRTVLMALVCVLVGMALGVLRAEPVRHGPVAELAADHARVTAEADVATDPKPRDGYVIGRLRLTEVTSKDQVSHTNALVILVADTSWAATLPGQRVRVSGRLEPTRGDGRESALLKVAGDPDIIDAEPSRVARLTEPLRAGLREAAATVDGDARGLIPAMLVGDESLMADSLRDDMLHSGLAHLTAVSGTNVTIVLIMVLGVARWLGVGGYVLHVLGVLAIVGFVALARPDPSVVRAAVMGAIAIAGVLYAGHRRGLRTLAAAVAVLLIVDPWLARSVGFALSVVATAAILLLSPAWQRAAAWLPGPVAVAVTVPLAAQVACLPLLVSIGGVASIASVPANILAAPAVALITVLSAGVAIAAPIAPVAAAAIAWLAAWPARWISWVARWCSDLPGAVVGWPVGIAGVVLAVGISVAVIAAAPAILRRRGLAVGAAAMLVAALAVQPSRLPLVRWLPEEWVLVACDVGQGDALVLRAGDGTAVVVDAGSDADAVRMCLDDMGITRVPVLVLTHFDDDHVGGVPGVLAGREVGRAVVSPVALPEDAANQVGRWLAEAHVPVEVATAGTRHRIGPNLAYEVVWPRRRTKSGSESNNASVVLRAEADGVRMLLTGDIEPQAQIALRDLVRGDDIDVFKVPHHGSPNQDREFLAAAAQADVALISVGENDYGHPAREVIDQLAGAGTTIARTDQHGTFAIVRMDDGELAIARR